MEQRLLHVFRNTPLGRETLMQSVYFCGILGVALNIYIPVSNQFLLYFDHDAVQVDLDSSYLACPESARANAEQIAREGRITPNFVAPKNFTASQLPDIPTQFNFMSCPRSISDLSSKIGLGYIGPKVRRIIKSSNFPVLMTPSVFKEWKSLMVFYGGSINANKALRQGLNLSKRSGYPLDMLTFMEGHDEAYFTDQMRKAGLWDDMQAHVRMWHRVSEGRFADSLYKVPHDALLLVGAYGHGLIKDFLSGSKMETIQGWMPNAMLLVGPNCLAV